MQSTATDDGHKTFTNWSEVSTTKNRKTTGRSVCRSAPNTGVALDTTEPDTSSAATRSDTIAVHGGVLCRAPPQTTVTKHLQMGLKCQPSRSAGTTRLSVCRSAPNAGVALDTTEPDTSNAARRSDTIAVHGGVLCRAPPQTTVNTYLQMGLKCQPSRSAGRQGFLSVARRQTQVWLQTQQSLTRPTPQGALTPSRCTVECFAEHRHRQRSQHIYKWV